MADKPPTAMPPASEPFPGELNNFFPTLLTRLMNRETSENVKKIKVYIKCCRKFQC